MGSGDSAYGALGSEFETLRTAEYEDLPSTLKAAKWLIEEVGVGSTFRGSELVARFPGILNITRRMRTLREAFGWVIPGSTQDETLPMGSYRLDEIGGVKPVRKGSVSGRLRRQVFERDHNRCLVCGIGAGEAYGDTGEVATLQLGHWVPKDQGGDPFSSSNLRTECRRCNEGIGKKQRSAVTLGSVLSRVDALKRADRQMLLAWIEANRREPETTEQLFYDWRLLPPEGREAVQIRLRGTDGK